MEMSSENAKRSKSDVNHDAKLAQNESVFDEELLKRVYYARLFPYEEMWKWLSYGNDESLNNNKAAIDKDYFYRREFSFTMYPAGEEVYIRYQSFRNGDDLKKAMLSKVPHKIDIGPVYNAPCKDRLTVAGGSFKPVERELIFDIDMTDYDNVRYCCNEANICRNCWSLMVVAIKVLDRALREDFGFKHILWVYSGRRGVHCWVSDKRARQLSDSGRAAIAQYLFFEAATDKNTKSKRLSHPLHPHFERAYLYLQEYFSNVTIKEQAKGGQAVFDFEERYQFILSLLPETLRKRFEQEYETKDTSAEFKWEQLKSTVKNEKLNAKNKSIDALWTCVQDIVFTYAYPRLDIEVSKHLNHLLKSPWAIHPKTGRVCVPIDPENVDAFDPFTTPTLLSMNSEINSFDMANPDQKHTTPDLHKTSLRHYVDFFNRSFLLPLYSSIRSESRELAEQHAAYNGDW
jgi:DNA primase small subunit